MPNYIGGIQQIGIGVENAREAFNWYRTHLGTDILVVDDEAEAALMTRYTNDTVQTRHAMLAVNLQGGGGLEIWQFKSRKSEPSASQIAIGDLGIYASKIKSRNVKTTHAKLLKAHPKVGPLLQTPEGKAHFFFYDPYGNLFQVVESESWFKKENSSTGGVNGAIIGVSDIEKASLLYTKVLGFDEVVYDEKGTFKDFEGLNGGDGNFRRVLLRQNPMFHKGSFSRLLGKTELELVQALDRSPGKIYEGRCWGDLGFIHLCFDVMEMDQFEKSCEVNGFPFTVDSKNAFDMGEAAGRFSYVEDPDGTLIEFVETHKIPILKKWKLYMNLKGRNPNKPLPDWMLRTLAFSRVKG